MELQQADLARNRRYHQLHHHAVAAGDILWCTDIFGRDHLRDCHYCPDTRARHRRAGLRVHHGGGPAARRRPAVEPGHYRRISWPRVHADQAPAELSHRGRMRVEGGGRRRDSAARGGAIGAVRVRRWVFG